jgi:hypothetical protein
MAKKTSEPKVTPARRGKAINKITVDYWKTKMHTAVIGIKKDIEYQAKTPQFTKEYEIKGAVYFNDDKSGNEFTTQVIAINKNDWEVKPLERRLMLRTFTTLEGDKGGRYMGGIELSMLESLELSMAAGDKPLACLIVTLPDYPYLTRIYKIRRITGDSFCFILPPPETTDRFLVIELAWKAGAGNDFNIKEGDEVIGDIDDKVLDIGGKFEIAIKKEEYQNYKELHQILVLFCCAMKYLKETEDDIEKLLKQVQKKKGILETNFKPFLSELDFFKNPRKFGKV